MQTSLTDAWQHTIAQRRRFRLWRDDGDLPTKKPVLASREVIRGLVNDEIASLFGSYIDWLASSEGHINKDAHVFAIDDSRGRRVWIVNDGPVITMLYPHES